MNPMTRKETFLAKAGGQSVNTPKPITREEMFLDAIAKSGGGGGGTGVGSGGGTSKAVQAITLTEEVDSVELKIPYEKLPVNVIYSFDLQGSDTITDTNYTSNNLSLNGTSIFRDQKILPTKAQKESYARVGRCIVTIQVSVDAIYTTFAYINTTNGEIKNNLPSWHLHHEPENGEITMKFSTWAGAKLGTGSTFRMAVI